MKIKLMEMFDQSHLFIEKEISIYGKLEKVSFTTAHLFWMALAPVSSSSCAKDSNFSARRAVRTKAAPAEARPLARQAPIPLEAPVIRAVLPVSEKRSAVTLKY